MRILLHTRYSALLLTGFLGWVCITAESIHAQATAFPGISGPLQVTELPPESVKPTDPGIYYNSSRNNLAIFLRDPQSSWLGLAHGLKSIGVPFSVITDLDEALAHDVMLVYPSLTGANTPPEMLLKLQKFVTEGNSLIAFSVIGGGMKALFGYGDYQERSDLQALHFNDSELVIRFVSDPAESAVNLAGRGQYAGGVSYGALAYPAIASFNDGSGAIISNSLSSEHGIGYAYAIGFDLSHFALRAYNGRLVGAVDDYVNAYQPKVDSLLRFIAAVYWQGEDDSIEILATPFNKEFTALITHDIDYTRSLTNAITYAGAGNRTRSNRQLFYSNQVRNRLQRPGFFRRQKQIYHSTTRSRRYGNRQPLGGTFQ